MAWFASAQARVLPSSARAPSSNLPAGLKDALHDYERRLIESTLAETGGNVSLAARRLQIHRVQLHAKMRALGVVRRPT